MGENKKNILIVDDSALMRRVESDIINSDDRFQAMDMAANGLEAFDFVTRGNRKYDCIILDINMPKMNGLEFLEACEKLKLKTKVIIVSTVAAEGTEETIKALELGAFDYVTKPGSFMDAMGSSFRKHLLMSIAYATGVASDYDAEIDRHKQEAKIKPQTPGQIIAPKSVTSGLSSPTATVKPVIKTEPKPDNRIPEILPSAKHYSGEISPMNPRAILASGIQKKKPHKQITGPAKRIVLIASSTGGPKALQSVIPLLPKNLNAPVLLVQHMSVGFTASLASRLDEMSQIKVVEAKNGDVIKKGVVYLAKGGTQMRLFKRGGDYVLDLNEEEPARNGLKPCADILFESVSELDFEDITCSILTGMGGDGTLGVKKLNEKHNMYVIAQDEQTSTVYGMPKVVYDAGLSDVVRPLGEIATEIIKNAGVQ